MDVPLYFILLYVNLFFIQNRNVSILNAIKFRSSYQSVEAYIFKFKQLKFLAYIQNDETCQL